MADGAVLEMNAVSSSNPLQGERGERRDVAARKAVVRRVITEYEEMPGVQLTLAQAQRLFGLRADVCVRVLEELVAARVLRREENGAFALNLARP